MPPFGWNRCAGISARTLWKSEAEWKVLKFPFWTINGSEAVIRAAAEPVENLETALEWTCG